MVGVGRVRMWWAVVLLCTVSFPAAAALSPAEEARLGKELLAQARPLELTDSPALDGIGARLAKTMTRKDVPWSFRVVEDMKEYNAFAAPGGFVFISRPYLEKLNTNEAAFVIGHEMAHVDLRHHEKQMKRTQKANIGSILLRVLTNSSVVGTAADISATAYVTHYSRVLEREADFAGYHYAEQAGYDPGAAVTALSKLGKDSKLHPWIATVYNTHPVLSSREDQLAALKGKEPDTSSPPPPSPEFRLSAGLQPFAPPIPVAVRVLAPDGKRWENAWRKSLTKLVHMRLTPLGFKIAGDDLMYKPDIGDPIAAARSRQARYLLLLTMEEVASKSEGAAKATGQPVTAKLEAKARFLDVESGKEVWAAELKGTAAGTDLLPSDPETLYPDTTLGGLVWREAGEMAVNFAKKLGAGPEKPKAAEETKG